MNTEHMTFAAPLTTDEFVSQVERIDFTSLISHQFCVEAHETLGQVHGQFQRNTHEFVAVVEDRRIIGLCSRGQIGFLLGSRFGFAIYGEHEMRQHLLAQHLQIARLDSLRDVLSAALSREGERFYDDVVLVEPDGTFCGFIAVETLVKKQSALLAEQLHWLQAQRAALCEKNQDLFRSVNQLRQSQARAEILFQNSALGVALLNLDGEVESANQQWHDLLQIPQTEATPMQLTRLITFDERETFRNFLKRHDQMEPFAGPSHAEEFKISVPQRGLRLFKFFGRRISETGQICVFIDDITEQRAWERAALHKEKQALLETLVGGISHEINNKLSPILGFSDLMLDECESHPEANGKFMGYCKIIHNCAQESAHIVRQLLQLSKPMRGEPAGCDLREVVRDALMVLQFKLNRTGARLETELPEEPVVVYADASQVKQVVINLANNALDAMQESPQRVLRVTLEMTSEQARLRVKDTGEGMPRETLGRIFDPFFTTKGPDRGTGLGLSVCTAIIGQHAGEIRVTSEVGRGSEFEIILPLSDLHIAETSPKDSRPTGLALPSFTKRILVVDDEEFITFLIRETLRKRGGCQVVTAGGVDEAIRRMEEQPFDLIISDVRMPFKSGLDFYAWLRVHHPQMAGRFIFVSGDDIRAEIDALFFPARVVLLPKPFQVGELVNLMDSMLNSPAQIPDQMLA